MDQPGRYRSRIGKPSGLRPPTARGAAAAAAAAGACPAAQGPTPCPGSPTGTLTRLPQVQSGMPRPVYRLAEPRIQRVASPPRSADTSTPKRVIPKPTGLRPPGSYAAASRLPSAPRGTPQRKPTPEIPTASTVPVARVVSPGPRVASPTRTVAVPIPHNSPVAVAAVAAEAATITRRRIPPPSRLRSPVARTESLVAVPIMQAPGSPPKSILVPESVAATEEEPIVALPRTPPMDEVDRNWLEVERRLAMERGTPTPKMSGRRRRRLSRPPRLSPIMERGSPEEAAAVINQVMATAAVALEQKEQQEADAVSNALNFIQEQRRRLVLSPERASKAIAKKVLLPATMRYIDQKWDALLRDLYGGEYADPLLQEGPSITPFLPGHSLYQSLPRSPGSPTSTYVDRRWEALGQSVAEEGLIEAEEMPGLFSPPREGSFSPARDVARRLTFGGEGLSSSSLSDISAGSTTVLQELAEVPGREGFGSSSFGTIAGSNPPVNAMEFLEDIEAPPEFDLPDIDMDEPIDYILTELEDIPQDLPLPLRPALPPPRPVMDFEDVPEDLPEPLTPYRTPPMDFHVPKNLPPPLRPLSPTEARLPRPLIPQIITYLPEPLTPTIRSPIGSPLGSPLGSPTAEEEIEEEEEDLYKIIKY